ncbi:MAG: hydrogenase maturation protease [Bryobacteraceae bacterium]
MAPSLGFDARYVVLLDDGGTQGLALLDRIASRRVLLVLDAVALGAEPGTVHVLRGWKHAGERASTAHESNVAELLQASTLLGECPAQVTVIGIEPERIATGMGVSEAVATAVGKAVEAARRELAGKQWPYMSGGPVQYQERS